MALVVLQIEALLVVLALPPVLALLDEWVPGAAVLIALAACLVVQYALRWTWHLPVVPDVAGGFALATGARDRTAFPFRHPVIDGHSNRSSRVTLDRGAVDRDRFGSGPQLSLT